MPGAFLLTPQEHRDRAEYLRLIGTPAALEQAIRHEQLAKAIEKRLEQNGADYPLVPY
jgi:hypothetical protein